MTILIKSKRALLGPDLDPVDNARIVVQDDRIVSVGSDSEQNPEGTGETVIDLGDATVLPGFVEAHGHLGIDTRRTHEGKPLDPYETLVWATRHARIDLYSGVTSMRNIGAPGYLDITLRDMLALGVIPGPRLVVSGPGLTATDGWADYVSQIADGPDEIRKAVRRNIKRGAEWIKLFVSGGAGAKPAPVWTSFYSTEEVTAAVSEAHRAGRWVAAHVLGGPGIRTAVEGGVDTIEHGHFVTPEDCALIAASGTWVVFNLSLFYHQGPDTKWEPEHLRFKARIRDMDGQYVKLAREHGVKFAVATDGMHGLIGLEAEVLVGFGLTPREAIIAITRSAAEACHLEDVGTLEAGRLADIVAVEGDALTDISAVRRVKFVMQGGRQVGLEKLENDLLGHA